MKAHVQLVARVPVELKKRLVAAAKRKHVSANSYLIEVLTDVVGRTSKKSEGAK